MSGLVDKPQIGSNGNKKKQQPCGCCFGGSKFGYAKFTKQIAFINKIEFKGNKQNLNKLNKLCGATPKLEAIYKSS